MIEIKAAEVVLDFGLYPRRQVDSHHVGEMCEAEKAGIEFPPIIIDKKSRRCVDGFHRVRKQLRVHGENATISAVEKTYKSDKAMFLDAMKYNANHGRALSSYDRAHSVILADRLGISNKQVAEALAVTIDRVESLRVDKTAVVGNGKGLRVPIKRTIRHMAGKKLTRKQGEANTKLGGMEQLFYVNQLITLLESDLIDKENEDLIAGLEKLKRLLP